MKNYTWIEFPTWILAQQNKPEFKLKLSTSDFILIANICSKVDTSGHINLDELEQILVGLGYTDLSILFYYSSNNILSCFEGFKGAHLNFYDKKQLELLDAEKIDEEDRISRLAFPLELTNDKRLSFEDFRFLAFCFEFSKLRNGNDYSFIDFGAVKVFTEYFDYNFKMLGEFPINWNLWVILI